MQNKCIHNICGQPTLLFFECVSWFSPISAIAEQTRDMRMRCLFVMFYSHISSSRAHRNGYRYNQAGSTHSPVVAHTIYDSHPIKVVRCSGWWYVYNNRCIIIKQNERERETCPCRRIPKALLPHCFDRKNALQHIRTKKEVATAVWHIHILEQQL